MSAPPQQDASAPAAAFVVAVDGTCTLPRERIGGKAWSVNRMRALGLRVPPAIVATTDACHAYFANGRMLPEALWRQIVEQVSGLESRTGRRFGAAERP